MTDTISSYGGEVRVADPGGDIRSGYRPAEAQRNVLPINSRRSSHCSGTLG